MNVSVYVLQAFIHDGKGGNAAGVVLDADNLSEGRMLEIAKKAGFSETAFVLKSNMADFRVRFYTPTEEVNLCGHATVATFSLLRELGMTSANDMKQETKAGVLGIHLREKGCVFYDQNLPIFGAMVPKASIVRALGIPVQWIEDTGMESQVVSTGMRDIVVAIDSRDHLYALQPDFEAIAKLSKDYDSIGMHVFTFDTLHPDSIAHCRNFAPLYDINEEAATGSSNGALACYLSAKGKLPGDTKRLVFEQGYNMHSPSEIIVSLEKNERGIENVRVGGKAVGTDMLNIEIGD